MCSLPLFFLFIKRLEHTLTQLSASCLISRLMTVCFKYSISFSARALVMFTCIFSCSACLIASCFMFLREVLFSLLKASNSFWKSKPKISTNYRKHAFGQLKERGNLKKSIFRITVSLAYVEYPCLHLDLSVGKDFYQYAQKLRICCS